MRVTQFAFVALMLLIMLSGCATPNINENDQMNSSNEKIETSSINSSSVSVPDAMETSNTSASDEAYSSVSVSVSAVADPTETVPEAYYSEIYNKAVAFYNAGEIDTAVALLTKMPEDNVDVQTLIRKITPYIGYVGRWKYDHTTKPDGTSFVSDSATEYSATVLFDALDRPSLHIDASGLYGIYSFDSPLNSDGYFSSNDSAFHYVYSLINGKLVEAQDELENPSSGTFRIVYCAVSDSFTNKYGTAETVCAHPGCDSVIAASGDTNCCEEHSSICADCGCFVDEGNIYCSDCAKAHPSK